jgi:hypothetical protein
MGDNLVWCKSTSDTLNVLIFKAKCPKAEPIRIGILHGADEDASSYNINSTVMKHWPM